jgi:hypothetical protein
MEANLDILLQGIGNSPPSVVIGVAALNCWGTATRTLLETYYESRYKSLLLSIHKVATIAKAAIVMMARTLAHRSSIIVP